MDSGRPGKPRGWIQLKRCGMSNSGRKISRLNNRIKVGLFSVLLVLLPHYQLKPGSSQSNDKLTLRFTKRIPRPREQVLAVILSDDDRFLIPATWEKKTEIWDVESGRLIATVDGRVLRPYDYSDFKLLDAFSLQQDVSDDRWQRINL